MGWGRAMGFNPTAVRGPVEPDLGKLAGVNEWTDRPILTELVQLVALGWIRFDWV